MNSDIQNPFQRLPCRDDLQSYPLCLDFLFLLVILAFYVKHSITTFATQVHACQDHLWQELLLSVSIVDSQRDRASLIFGKHSQACFIIQMFSWIGICRATLVLSQSSFVLLCLCCILWVIKSIKCLPSYSALPQLLAPIMNVKEFMHIIIPVCSCMKH